MTEQVNSRWTKEHIGSRIVYTGRNGYSKTGVIRGVHEEIQMVDVKLDGGLRPVFYVPGDTLKLVPDDLDATISSE